MDFGVEKVDLARIQFTQELLSRVPAGVARRFGLLPVFRHGDCLVVVFGSKLPEVSIIDEALDALCGPGSEIRQLQVVVADEWQLGYFMRKFYGQSGDPAI